MNPIIESALADLNPPEELRVRYTEIVSALDHDEAALIDRASAAVRESMIAFAAARDRLAATPRVIGRHGEPLPIDPADLPTIAAARADLDMHHATVSAAMADLRRAKATRLPREMAATPELLSLHREVIASLEAKARDAEQVCTDLEAQADEAQAAADAYRARLDEHNAAKALGEPAGPAPKPPKDSAARGTAQAVRARMGALAATISSARQWGARLSWAVLVDALEEAFTDYQRKAVEVTAAAILVDSYTAMLRGTEVRAALGMTNGTLHGRLNIPNPFDVGTLTDPAAAAVDWAVACHETRARYPGISA